MALRRCIVASKNLGFAGVLLIELSRQQLRTTCIAAEHNDDSDVVLDVIHVLLSIPSTTPGGRLLHRSLLPTSFDLG